MFVHVAQVVPCTEAEGPGKRFAIWFQGCPLRCAECCNPEMLPFEGGTRVPVDRLLDSIESAQRQDRIEGVTFLGGEPFAHAEAAVLIATFARQLGLSVMVFSGYTLSELRCQESPTTSRLIESIDLLVDGPYDKTRPDTARRWIGSTNQEIHFLTNRYSETDAYWKESNTLEIRWDGEGLTVNGFPAARAIGIWRRPSSS